MSKIREDIEECKEEIKEHAEKDKKKIKALGPTKFTILLILVIGTVCSYVFYDFFHGENNYFNGINPETGMAWDHGSKFLNDLLFYVPNVIFSLRFITVFLVIVTLIIYIIKKHFTRTQRAITVGGLICNLIRWITAVVLVLGVLYQWGVDAGALVTGAGVLTLVLGLGMQSLIADVVAGLFIVFENEFNVGDWLTVDDFYGQVVSIGIRTTKLKCYGNIKIINNNELHGVINKSVEPSVALTYIDVEYGAKLPEVEKIIKENIGKLKIPGALGQVRYDGVTALGASGVTLRFQVDCLEDDFYRVGRALNGAIKNMFDENGIGIPFPQVVVHKGD